MIDNTQLIEAAKTVACVEVLDDPPHGAKVFAGPFYPDESDGLCEFLRGLRGRELFAVSTGKNGFVYIYRKQRQ